MPTKKEQKAAIIAAGRKYLRAWLLNAMRTGKVYYKIQRVSRSGMRREIQLFTVRKGEIDALWPRLPEIPWIGFDHSDALDIIARDWGFNWDKRAFVIGGCGMDMVFALVDDLQHRAGLGKTAWERQEYDSNRNRYPYKRVNKPMDGKGRVTSFTNAIDRQAL